MMRRLKGLWISLAGLMLMATPALAVDYNFETPAPKDFYARGVYRRWRGAHVPLQQPSSLCHFCVEVRQ